MYNKTQYCYYFTFYIPTSALCHSVRSTSFLINKPWHSGCSSVLIGVALYLMHVSNSLVDHLLCERDVKMYSHLHNEEEEYLNNNKIFFFVVKKSGTGSSISTYYNRLINTTNKVCYYYYYYFNYYYFFFFFFFLLSSLEKDVVLFLGECCRDGAGVVVPYRYSVRCTFSLSWNEKR